MCSEPAFSIFSDFYVLSLFFVVVSFAWPENFFYMCVCLKNIVFCNKKNILPAFISAFYHVSL